MQAHRPFVGEQRKFLAYQARTCLKPQSGKLCETRQKSSSAAEVDKSA